MSWRSLTAVKSSARGTPVALKEFTKAASLEEAFITLTGHAIRDESASAQDRMRTMGKVWGRT